jgi:orotidine-5'-phosphate decarboxylase
MEMLENLHKQQKLVCVGLDVKYPKIPECVRKEDVGESIFVFNKIIIDATKDIVCAYKPNFWFYLAEGTAGLNALKETIGYIHCVSDVPVVIDAKVGDIGNTNEAAVEALFGKLDGDAVTINPYVGKEALMPFLNQKNKGIIILCKTSNPGSKEFQNLIIEDGRPLYQHVADNVANIWDENKNCFVVVGATYPSELKDIRAIIGEMGILLPGIGAQGGDLEQAILNGINRKKEGVIINSGRKVLEASTGSDFGQAARAEVQRMNTEINSYQQKY